MERNKKTCSLYGMLHIYIIYFSHVFQTCIPIAYLFSPAGTYPEPALHRWVDSWTSKHALARYIYIYIYFEKNYFVQAPNERSSWYICDCTEADLSHIGGSHSYLDTAIAIETGGGWQECFSFIWIQYRFWNCNICLLVLYLIRIPRGKCKSNRRNHNICFRKTIRVF